MWIASRIEGVVRAAQEWLQPPAVLRRRLLDERHADGVRPGGQTHFRPRPRLHIVAGKRRVPERRLEILIAAEGRQVNTRAVHTDLDLMLVLQPAHRTEIGPEQARLDHVLAFERQRDVCEHAADGSDRQPFDVTVLRCVLADAERFTPDAAFWIANGQRTDLSRCREIPLEQHRRYAQHIGDVVEAVRGVVSGQERRRIDLECQQVTNRIAVLGSIQPVHERPTRIGMRDRVCVERVGQPR